MRSCCVLIKVCNQGICSVPFQSATHFRQSLFMWFIKSEVSKPEKAISHNLNGIGYIFIVCSYEDGYISSGWIDAVFIALNYMLNSAYAIHIAPEI